MKEFHKRRIHIKEENTFWHSIPSRVGKDHLMHFTILLDYLKSSDIFCPRKLFWAKNPLPKKALQKISVYFCLKNQSCCRRYPPPHNQIYFRIWYAFSMLKLTKFPHAYGAGFKFYYTKYFLNRFIPHVSRARPTHGPWPGSKKVQIWPKIE